MRGPTTLMAATRAGRSAPGPVQVGADGDSAADHRRVDRIVIAHPGAHNGHAPNRTAADQPTVGASAATPASPRRQRLNDQPGGTPTLRCVRELATDQPVASWSLKSAGESNDRRAETTSPVAVGPLHQPLASGSPGSSIHHPDAQHSAERVHRRRQPGLPAALPDSGLVVPHQYPRNRTHIPTATATCPAQQVRGLPGRNIIAVITANTPATITSTGGRRKLPDTPTERPPAETTDHTAPTRRPILGLARGSGGRTTAAAHGPGP